ncbi:hypothetical protein BJY16_008574 [Actinoplanes octamycinicus]|uniref:Uncharacterized protein n=1 Tax=Actinoplanes octamycinicus TaxID=135948 RepID=A0A7W7H6W2_9ACTN|nr:hypothetical protein [Actinoplanes octamycinicus]MBB4745115.1 hypothetical protein [Actinoplanes octamycinicus]GIE55699.1 hypothetical protein Aoc01nite_11010 [Actinoplanes octamycinicus]
MEQPVPVVLALTPTDARRVEAVRADASGAEQEIVGHALLGAGRTALCGAEVTAAVPRTGFHDDFLDEQWGPIRLCGECSRRTGNRS